MKQSKKIDGLLIPAWIDILTNIDETRFIISKMHLCKCLKSSYRHSTEILTILERKGFVTFEKEIGVKRIPVTLTERGKELKKLLLFILNYIR